MGQELKIFSGSANIKLAEDICKVLGVLLGKAYVGKFADGEIIVRIEENVRGRDCFVVQPTCPPVNENVMELLIMVDALKRASAERITAVMPYYGYGRQDRKVEPRVPISSKLVANLLTTAGVNRILTMDLHAGQIQGFFDIPVDHLFAMPVFLDYLKKEKFDDEIIVVAPDAGGVERARGFAKRLECELAIIDKRRSAPNEAAVMHVIGDVRDKSCIIVDDIVDTARTLVRVAEALKNNGAKRILTACSHALLSGNALEYIESSSIEQLIITDSVPLEDKSSEKIVVLSVAKLLAEAIKRIHIGESVSALFV